MSRSYRHTPIVGTESTRSEKKDKKIWHGRMRAKQKNQISSIGMEDADMITPVTVKEVSRIDDMTKNGRSYWSEEDRLKEAKALALRKAANDQERESIVVRLMEKWRSK